ncbi:MAG: Gmad2 immunoglobulin-like domain-containing protein, partial [Gaiellales bacterium]
MSLRILALGSVCVIAAGCGGTGAVDVGPASGQGPPTGPAAIVSSSSSSTASASTGTPSRMRVEVWLVRRGKLWPVERSVRPTPAVLGASVSALLDGPTTAEAATGVRSAVPAGTQLLGISLHGGIATVDVTSEFEGGSVAREKLSLAQLVYAVTQFPTVHGLRLHLDGQPVTAFTDGLVLPDPIVRTSMGFGALVPPITVTSPRPGASVRAPFTVSGIADVFEAGLTYRLLDASGNELGSGSSSASCGTGCPGTFSFQLPELGVSTIQQGTLVISGGDASGQPGGGQTLRLPLRLVPPFDVTSPRPGATLTSPAIIALRYPSATRVLLRVFDAHFHLLGRRVISADCIGPCPPNGEYSNHVHFSVAGLQRG